ncbi:uncharacterized protein LOC123226447 [Mangifera indica]|uniref:uncharacterized protein LOC123226447 n=1 Tax=Mangifera indica TaxID=29780 RepID=UPI001CFA9EA2|nr:uncharacterized protein LOC123226447 [Mangifera indica]
MACYRRAKLVFDSFRDLSSKLSFLSKPTIRDSSSRIYQSNSVTTAKFSGFNSFSSVFQRVVSSARINKYRYNSFYNNTMRNYYVDRYHVQHFRQRGPRKWLESPKNVLTFVLVGSGIVITVYLGNLETVPYTKRTHFVLLSKVVEKKIGETQFEQMKAAYKGKILPAIHPDSVRVRLISNDIIRALRKGLKHETVWSDMGYASPESDEADGGRAHETLRALSEALKGRNLEGDWHKEDEFLHDKSVQHTRKKGQEIGLQAATSHLDGLNWEVLVVNEPVVNAFCLPGGKIVVFTGLLDHFRTDAEIATIIGHEVGHALARHAAEGITKNLWFAILQLILYQFVVPDVINTMSTLFLRLPFSRKMELEADYIGLLLVASAGYDPQVAPRVYEKLGQISGDSKLRDYLSTHPSGKKRAQLLAQAKVMEEALTIYQEVRSGYGVEGFL